MRREPAVRHVPEEDGIKVTMRGTAEEMKLARATLAFIDGEDVTSRCFEADNEEGWVALFAEDERGHFIGYEGHAIEVLRRGRVEFKERLEVGP